MSYQDGLEDEVERLRAEMERLRGDFQCCADVGRRMEAEVEGLRAEVGKQEDVLVAWMKTARAAEAERDRLRAVLAEAATIVEETDVVEAPRGDTYYAQLGDARATLKAAAAALRARAGEPTPADPRPLREIVHAGEPSADGVFFVDLICGHRIATRQRQGEYPCLYCGSGERRRPAP